MHLQTLEREYLGRKFSIMLVKQQKKSLAPINNEQVIAAFNNFIVKKNHPCIMAKSMFQMDKFQLHTYSTFGGRESSMKLFTDLENYIKSYDFDSNLFETFIAVFPNTGDFTEVEFEQKLWKQLQELHEVDTYAWDKDVSMDPEDTNFSFSLAGRAFYIVGMHPNSSRKARQSPYTAIAFNLHWQFEKLREMGAYQKVRDKIRKRDKKMNGSINPTLQDFGTSPETLQYSGKYTDSSWKCPFHQKK